MSIVNEYRFETQEGTSLIDLTASGNNGTLGGATLPQWDKELDESKKRDMLSLVGGNGATKGDRSRANFAITDFQYSTSSNFSICMLFKSSKADSNLHMLFHVGNGDGTEVPAFYAMLNADEKLQIQFATASGVFKSYTTTDSYCDNKWHLVVVTFTSAGLALDLYIDGVLHNEGLSSGGTLNGNFYGANTKATIGAYYNNSTTNYNYNLTGSISYFQNADHAMSSSEIKALTERELLKVNRRKESETYTYFPPKNNIKEDLKNLYYLDTADGNDVVGDYAGTNNGTKGGTTKPTSIVLPNGMNGLHFDGGNLGVGDRGRVEMTTADWRYSATDSFSITFWFRSSKVDALNHFLVSLSNYIENGQIVMRLDASENLDFMIIDTAGNYKIHEKSGMCDGEWHFVAGTWDNGTMTLIIDGESIAQSAAGGTISGNLYEDTAQATIGASYYLTGSQYIADFTGDMALVENHSKALSSTEINKLYRDTFIA